MRSVYEDYEGGETDLRPIVGIFTCILCERSFSTKNHLKQHYHSKHQESLPNYEGQESVYGWNRFQCQRNEE